MNALKCSIGLISAVFALSPAFAEEETTNGLSVSNRVRFEYDNNIRQADSGNEDASFKILEELELTYNVLTEASQIGVRYMPSFVWFEDRAEDEWDIHHQADVSLSQRLSESLRLSAKDTLRIAELPELIEGTGVVRENNDYIYNSASAALDQDLSPTTTIQGNYRNELLSYVEDDVADVSDYTKNAFGASLINKINERTDLSGEYVYDGTDYEDNIRTYQSSQFGLSLERQLSEVSFFNVRGGYELRSFDAEATENAESPYFSGGLVLAVSEATKVNLDAGYYMAQTPTSSYATQDQTIFSAGIAQEVAQDLTINVSGSYSMGNYDSGYSTEATGPSADSPSDDTLQIGVRLVYHVNLFNWLEIGWQHIDYDTDLTATAESGGASDMGLRDYTRDRISAGWRTRL